MPQNEPPVAAPASRHAGRALAPLVFLASAGVYLAVRLGAPSTLPTFYGACQRLRDSGLALTSKDWFCNPAPWTWRAATLVATLLLWIAFVLPCAILASTGRKLTAVLPMAVAPFLTFLGVF